LDRAYSKYNSSVEGGGLESLLRKIGTIDEVKYRKTKKKSDILAIATRMTKSWNPSYLFLATQDGFYFDEAADIVKNKGVINHLSHPQIPDSLQQEYLNILNDFEQ
jgi:hypothetical protein